MSLTLEIGEEVDRLKRIYGIEPADPPLLTPIEPLEGERQIRAKLACKVLLDPKNFTLSRLSVLTRLTIHLNGGEKDLALGVEKSNIVESGWGDFYWQVRTSNSRGNSREVEIGLITKAETQETFLYGQSASINGGPPLLAPTRVFISETDPEDCKVYSRLLRRNLSIPPEKLYEPRYSPSLEQVRKLVARQFYLNFPGEEFSSKEPQGPQ